MRKMLPSAALKLPKWMGLAERSDMRLKTSGSVHSILAAPSGVGTADTQVAAMREARAVNFILMSWGVEGRMIMLDVCCGDAILCC